MSEEVESKAHPRASAYMTAQVDKVVLVALDKDTPKLKRARKELLAHIAHLEAENADLRKGIGHV